MSASEDDPLYYMNRAHKEELESIPDSWMIRKCSQYYEEYKLCSRFRGKFHQVFVHGHPLDCSSWIDNFKDCKQWGEQMDEEAAKRIIEREKERLKDRLQGHATNDVWERRTSPPENWNKSLPEHLLPDDDSYLELHKETKLSGERMTMTQNALTVQAKVATVLQSCSIM